MISEISEISEIQILNEPASCDISRNNLVAVIKRTSPGRTQDVSHGMDSRSIALPRPLCYGSSPRSLILLLRRRITGGRLTQGVGNRRENSSAGFCGIYGRLCPFRWCQRSRLAFRPQVSGKAVYGQSSALEINMYNPNHVLACCSLVVCPNRQPQICRLALDSFSAGDIASSTTHAPAKKKTVLTSENESIGDNTAESGE